MSDISKFKSKFTPNNIEAMFISVDKMTIKLPVPLGTEVYEAWTGCCNLCKNRKYAANDEKVIDCNQYAVCHTTIPKICS